MRFIVAIGFAVTLFMPVGTRAHAAASARPFQFAQSLASDDVSAAKRKRVKRKAAKQEQYLRAVPSAPPAGAKQ